MREPITARRMEVPIYHCILLLSSIIGCAYSQPIYSVIAPSSIRPNSEYHVAVMVAEISTPVTMLLEIEGHLDNGERFNLTEIINTEPYATRIVNFNIGEISSGRYKLNARVGPNGVDFFNTTNLEFVPKSLSIFIQTDRAVYKPGSKVQFRCIALDSRLRPLPTRQVDIHITDGKGNRIKQWNRPTLTSGVFNGELELSKSPVLGDWTIVALVENEQVEKKFLVAEYVLPKFEVTITTPEHVTFKEGKIVATVHARYTYGKPVKGEVTVTAHPNIFSGVIQPFFQTPIRKVLPIDGKVTVDFDIVKDLRVTEEYERPIQLDVAVEEELTGRHENVSKQITLHKHRYSMDLVKTSNHYKPGLKYTVFLKLRNHDGTPVIDKTNPVMISYGYTYNQSAYTNITRFLDEQGIVQLDLNPPLPQRDDNYRHPLNIEASYLNLHEWFGSINQAISPSNTYLQATLRTPRPRVNEEVLVEVTSTIPLKYLSYQVLGRGDILYAASVPVPNTRDASVRFLATPAMAPTAKVVIYYVRDDGEIVADALDVELDGVLQNFVDVNMTPSDTKPGRDVELVITTKPRSYIGLMGIDQRSLMLRSGNDITHSQVIDELRSYDSSRHTKNIHGLWRHGAGAAQNVFNDHGLVILSNGYVHRNVPILHYKSNLDNAVIYENIATTPVTSPGSTKVRKNFPETWLWQTLDSGYEGRAVIKRTVPDSITSWVITAFSIDSLYGLGIVEAPKKLKVFKEFFVTVDLPYSIVRGEAVSIPVVVSNYLNKELSAEVMLQNDGDLMFADMSNEVNENKEEQFRRKWLNVKTNDKSSTSFMIIPKKLGYVTIRVSATSTLAGDTVEHKLLVKPEGETLYANKAMLLDLRDGRPLNGNITIDVPKNIVSDSDYVEISAVGDLLGPSIPNLENLIQMPFGCGEQNMLNFVPNIVIMNYLKNTNQLTQAIQSKAMMYLETGYQQELTYRHKDGSFSAFGDRDASGSTWLTGFVAKSFTQARGYIKIDDNIIQEAYSWLASKQAPNGSFPEVGKIVHADMQGGASNGLSLTAFTVISFLENDEAYAVHRNTVKKGLEYILRNLEGTRDLYALSLCGYALSLARNSYEDLAFNLLETRASTRDDTKWWSKQQVKDERNPWHKLPQSVDVEMTSYALLIYLRRNLISDSIPVLKWLIQQRNKEGGFASTQDTVVGIYALSKLAEKISSRNNNVAVTFTSEKGEQRQININPGNNMILQKYMLPQNTRMVNISASGTGFALVQLSVRYNLNVTGAYPLFTLDPQVDRNSNKHHLQLSVCSGFVPTATANESNMAVMEVNLPSGFTVDVDSLPSLEVSQNVRRVETKNGGTLVILYFDKMGRKEFCPTVSAFRTHFVAKQKPVPVTVYDYYDSTRRARTFYRPQLASLCDICEGDDCKYTCSSRVSKLGGDEQEEEVEGIISAISGASSHLSFTQSVLVCLYLMKYFFDSLP